MIDKLLGLTAFALVISVTPGPNNTLLLASGIQFGFTRTLRHVFGTAMGMAVLIFTMAAGIGVVLLALPGAELAVKVIGSAYLLYLAFRIAASHGVSGRTAARPFGVLQAAAFQFANPKSWLFGLAAAGTFLPQGLAPAAAGLVVAATCAVVIVPSASLWAAGGAALNRIVQSGRAQRAVRITLALILAASVAFIWI